MAPDDGSTSRTAPHASGTSDGRTGSRQPQPARPSPATPNRLRPMRTQDQRRHRTAHHRNRDLLPAVRREDRGKHGQADPLTCGKSQTVTHTAAMMRGPVTRWHHRRSATRPGDGAVVQVRTRSTSPVERPPQSHARPESPSPETIQPRRWSRRVTSTAPERCTERDGCVGDGPDGHPRCRPDACSIRPDVTAAQTRWTNRGSWRRFCCVTRLCGQNRDTMAGTWQG
jgi:hypothetical protein